MSENQNLTNKEEIRTQVNTPASANGSQSDNNSSSIVRATIDSEIAEKFYALAKEWQNQVEGLSSTAQTSQHPAYQEIVSMGNKVVPLLLQELKHNPLYWLSALHSITGANPIKPEQRGRVKQMAEAWLEWGKNQGYMV